MTRKQQRLIFVVVGLACLGVATALMLFALRDSIMFFRSPSEVAAGQVSTGEDFRMGGLVEEGSVQRLQGSEVAFKVTDLENAIAVRFTGLLPDLFREGQGVVVEGNLDPTGTFKAFRVLAKHDETYMPKEVAEVLKQSGKWQGPES